MAGRYFDGAAAVPEDELMELGDHTYLARFDEASARLADVLATGDVAAPVPGCPGWTLADLGAHTGGIHQWAEHAVVVGTPDAQPTPAPATQAELADWYRRSAESLSATLRATDPAAEAWNFGPKPRTAAFWFRRQAHEATMHLTDALASQGVDPALVNPVLDDDEFAVDGINEVFEMFVPRQRRLGRLPELPYRLSLGAGPHRWSYGAGPGTEVTGPPTVVLLLVWGRIGLDDPRLAVTGDRRAAQNVLTAGLVP